MDTVIEFDEDEQEIFVDVPGERAFAVGICLDDYSTTPMEECPVRHDVSWVEEPTRFRYITHTVLEEEHDEYDFDPHGWGIPTKDAEVNDINAIPKSWEPAERGL